MSRQVSYKFPSVDSWSGKNKKDRVVKFLFMSKATVRLYQVGLDQKKSKIPTPEVLSTKIFLRGKMSPKATTWKECITI